MPDIPTRHDYALWLHLLTLTPEAIGVDAVLADHHRRLQSLSARGWHANRATWRMLHSVGRILRG